VASDDAETRVDRAAPPRLILAILCVAAIVGLDQATKSWAVHSLSNGPVNIIGSSVSFELARNSGSAFSRFQSFTPVLAVIAVFIAVVLVRTLRRTTDRWMSVALVVVLGGALGNLTDRFVRSPGFLRGAVVDFVKVGSFPLFNVADSAITLGAIAIGIHALKVDQSS
jgi:signal peptidase II